MPINPTPPYTQAWHDAEEATERAWLDQWARAERTPECPWTRPDHDVLADLTAFLNNQRLTAGSHS